MNKFTMRAPCTGCGSTVGAIVPSNGQDCVRCVCGRFQYNAPRTETGRAVRSVSTIHDAVAPKVRARVLMRDGSACAICHAADRPLHVGHLLSVEDGFEMGLSDAEINNEANLAAMCDGCNLGIGKKTLPLRLCASILLATIRNMNKGES